MLVMTMTVVVVMMMATEMIMVMMLILTMMIFRKTVMMVCRGAGDPMCHMVLAAMLMVVELASGGGADGVGLVGL